MTRALSIALTLAALTPSPQQPPQRDATSVAPTMGGASIAGKVVDDQAQPAAVRRAIVTVAGPGLVPSHSAITDDEGRFAIDRLPGGRFTITVSRASFVTSMYGAKRPGRPGTALVVSDGQRLSDV